MKIHNQISALALSMILLLSGCASSESGDSEIVIVATTSMLGDVAANVAGEDASVEVLMPVGTDPHLFSPSSQQVAAMNGADIVIVNGLGLEEQFEEVLEGVEADGGIVLEVGPMLDPIPFGLEPDDGDEHEHEGDDHHHGASDPHVWMDPVRIGEAARLIATALTELDGSSGWVERAEAYATELDEAGEEIERLLSGIAEEGRVLVTNHESLGYFAERYGFRVVGAVLPGGSTLGDPSSEELAALVTTMREQQVNVIFAETTQASTLAEAVAAELGEDVSVVELYTESLGAPGSGADTLIGMLLTDAMLIAEALSSGG